ncbi:hypothetical protein EVAR_102151_1 [Eumeta japonica]|uniref:Uncharacterized protein n=1 Tax=Eumeta variegata TaxID=151549 RepID=A0A4C1TZW1_EUMVA|nr:hypothetical protein EVAR_102151_1 [Eumeta japonica]
METVSCRSCYVVFTHRNFLMPRPFSMTQHRFVINIQLVDKIVTTDLSTLLRISKMALTLSLYCAFRRAPAAPRDPPPARHRPTPMLRLRVVFKRKAAFYAKSAVTVHVDQKWNAIITIGKSSAGSNHPAINQGVNHTLEAVRTRV